jgi:tripartite-type tricarboxylate transporter receptor subunit TctC
MPPRGIGQGNCAAPSNALHREIAMLKLASFALCAIATLASVAASAQTYPTRPVRIVVGFPPGGTQDIVARLVGQALSERLGQPFVIDNRPGAASNIAVDMAAHAPADGYTLLVVGLANAVNASLYDKLSFDFIRDIAPVASIARVPGVMVVTPSFPANTVAEFITYAKNNAGRISMGSGGNGSPQHLYGELFKMMSGVSMTHVPYRGGAPATADLMAGQIQVIFNPLPETIGHITAGKLRALAVTTVARSQVLPDVPPLREVLPNFEASSWYGLGVPKNTPAPVVSRINKEMNDALADAKLKSRLADLGGVLLGGSPADFGKLIADETAKWSKVVRATNMKAQ